MKNKILSFLCVAALFAASLSAGCGNASECRLEAEKAVVEPAYDSSVAAECRPNSKSENLTSNGKYVGKLQAGNKITWFFEAERTAGCAVEIAVANADENSQGFTAGQGKAFSVTLNGNAVELPAYEIAAGTAYCDNWQVLSLGILPVTKGVNKLVFTAEEGGSLNVDYLDVSTERTAVEEHNHYWKLVSTPATCTASGATYKRCDDCGYEYCSEVISELGHAYGDFHYDDASMKMIAECSRCGNKIEANTPSTYFGEVFTDAADFQTRPTVLTYEAEEAYVCVEAGLNNPNADSYIERDNGEMNSPSGGKSVGNISKEGNYILFTVESEVDCTSDIVLKMANVLYSSQGIKELSPMSDYVYCTINGEEVDFSFVSFPGYSEHKYYEWRYVVIKDVAVKAGQNTIQIGPKRSAGGSVTMPNTDALYVCTDGIPLRAVKTYDYNDVSVVAAYSGAYGSVTSFRQGESGYVFDSGVAAEEADFVVTLRADGSVPDLGAEYRLEINGNTVNLAGVSLGAGETKVEVSGVPLALLANAVTLTGGGDVQISAVRAYTPSPVPAALVCEADESYDYLKHGGNVPALVFEAENADLGNSVSSRSGVDMIELNVYENTGKRASGNSTVGNFATKGNVICWRFESSENVTADVALMLASANYSQSAGGNVATSDLPSLILVKINGVAVSLENIVLPVESLADYYNWQALTVKGVTLAAGVNEISVEVLSHVAPNMDVLYVYAEGASFAPCAAR